jgi:hypothetical protein
MGMVRLLQKKTWLIFHPTKELSFREAGTGRAENRIYSRGKSEIVPSNKNWIFINKK